MGKLSHNSVRTLYAEGLSQVDIAARHGVTRQAVSLCLERLGIRRPRPPAAPKPEPIRTHIGNRWNFERHQRVLGRIYAGWTQASIAAAEGITRSHVASIKKRHYARYLAALAKASPSSLETEA